MKNIYLVIALSLIFSTQAVAEDVVYSISCGENREAGFKQAEVALADDLDSGILLYLDGKRMPEEQVDMGNLDDGWLLTLHRKGKDARKFVFSESKKSVQEFLVEENGRQKKVGKPLPCLFPEE
jgi:hypothetical protein